MREILREAAWLFSQSETASVGQLKDLGNWRAKGRDAWESDLFEGRGAGAPTYLLLLRAKGRGI